MGSFESVVQAFLRCRHKRPRPLEKFVPSMDHVLRQPDGGADAGSRGRSDDERKAQMAVPDGGVDVDELCVVEAERDHGANYVVAGVEIAPLNADQQDVDEGGAP